jgi:hypothetical protein
MGIEPLKQAISDMGKAFAASTSPHCAGLAAYLGDSKNVLPHPADVYRNNFLDRSHFPRHW